MVALSASNAHNDNDNMAELCKPLLGSLRSPKASFKECRRRRRRHMGGASCFATISLGCSLYLY